MRCFEGYRCSSCGREVPAGTAAGECPLCSSPLLGVYDLALLRRNSTRKEFLRYRGRGVWDFAHLLPDFSTKISLGEGWTPHLLAERLGETIDAPELYVKDESLNPTGSFKARGMAVAVSRLLDLGIRTAYLPSAGNAALALSAYGAASRLAVRLFLPSSTPAGFAEECRAYGAEVEVVSGLLPDAARRMEAVLSDTRGLLSTFREPCRVEGKKTIAFELEAVLGSVDWIVFPTGGGTGVVAIWKAYNEMEELGWLSGGKPRIAVVQSTGCAPFVHAFESGAETAEPWSEPETVACGICVPSSRADTLVLRALRESGGAAIAVADSDILRAAAEISAMEGVLPSPEGAAGWAGLKELVARSMINPSDRIVLVNTAGGARYHSLLKSYSR
jgi:threonine synthase